MSIAEPLTVLKAELMHTLVPQLLELLTTALRDGTPVHQVERQLWDFALQLGRRSLTTLFAACGTGDRGATYERCVKWSPDDDWVMVGAVNNPSRLLRWPLSTGHDGDVTDIHLFLLSRQNVDRLVQF